MDNYCCPNCNHKLTKDDLFCSNCGQKRISKSYKLKDLFINFFEDYFSFDNKALNSLKALFTSPGKLTIAFFEGKRSSYALPLRLYLFVAFISIACISIINMRANSSNEILFEIEINNGTADEASMSESTADDSGGKELGTELAKELDYLIKNQGSIFVLLELPLFAFIVYLLYYKKNRFYMEAFVMALHLQTFLFITLLFGSLIDILLSSNYGLVISTIIYFIYSVIALKNYYNTTYFSSVFKLLTIQILQLTFLLLIMISYILVIAYSRGLV